MQKTIFSVYKETDYRIIITILISIGLSVVLGIASAISMKHLPAGYIPYLLIALVAGIAGILVIYFNHYYAILLLIAIDFGIPNLLYPTPTLAITIGGLAMASVVSMLRDRRRISTPKFNKNSTWQIYSLDGVMIFTTSLAIFFALFGLFQKNSLSYTTDDFLSIIELPLAYAAFRLIITETKQVYGVLSIGLLSSLTRLVYQYADYIFGSRGFSALVATGNPIRARVDLPWGETIVFIILIGVYLVSVTHLVKWQVRGIQFLLGVYGIFVLISFSRGNWFAVIVGFIFYLVSLRQNTIKRIAPIAITLVVLLIGVSQTAQSIYGLEKGLTQFVSERFLYTFEQIFEPKNLTQQNRITEVNSILSEWSFSTNTILLGKGLGAEYTAYFRTEYGNAYGSKHWTHIIFTQLLLRSGLVGLIGFIYPLFIIVSSLSFTSKFLSNRFVIASGFLLGCAGVCCGVFVASLIGSNYIYEHPVPLLLGAASAIGHHLFYAEHNVQIANV